MGSSSFWLGGEKLPACLAGCRLAALASGLVFLVVVGAAQSRSQILSAGTRKDAAASISSEVYVAPKIASTARRDRQALTLLAGAPGSTALQMAQDLAIVLGDSESVRIVPVVGRGGPQNLVDLLYLQGIDLAITQADVLAGISRGAFNNIKSEQIAYIAKLYNAELHVVARESVGTLTELTGQKVNFGEKASGSQFTARRVFAALGLNVQEVNLNHADAMAQLQRGEIAATIFIGGKPDPDAGLIAASQRMRLLPVTYAPELEADYLPAKIGHADYPELIAEGHSIDTIAVGTVLTVFNWPRGDERYRRSALFVESFFARLQALHEPARHGKWREMNIPASVPGIMQFAPAKAWIDRELKALAGQRSIGEQKPGSTSGAGE